MNQNQVDYDPDKLQKLADKLSQHFWQRSLTIPVKWNGRLTRAMGRFVYAVRGGKREPMRIEVSKYAASLINREIFLAVLLHEMCHYHLFIQGKPYQDHHPVFEDELRRVGAISTNTVKLPEKVSRLTCAGCGKYLGRMKRVNPQRYRSGCCNAAVTRTEEWTGSFHYDGKILKHSKVRIVSDGQDEKK